MPLTNVTKFEEFFRSAAGLNVDKNDLKRYSDFVNKKVHDLLVIGEAAAKANGRDLIEACDLPVTKGLQESINDFRRIDREVELSPVLDYLVAWPPLDMPVGDSAEARLLAVAGGLSVALGRAFKIIDPRAKRPMHGHWEQAFRLFDLLV
jgi:hypothetical protein